MISVYKEHISFATVISYFTRSIVLVSIIVHFVIRLSCFIFSSHIASHLLCLKCTSYHMKFSGRGRGLKGLEHPQLYTKGDTVPQNNL